MMLGCVHSPLPYMSLGSLYRRKENQLKQKKKEEEAKEKAERRVYGK